MDFYLLDEVSIMYRNIGEKIKALAIICCAIVSIACVVVGIVFWIEEDELFALLVFFGPVVAWVSSFCLYGFGEIITKLSDIEQNTRGGQIKTQIKEKTQKAKQNY